MKTRREDGNEVRGKQLENHLKRARKADSHAANNPLIFFFLFPFGKPELYYNYK
jgi:hypothetical protein